MQPRGVRQNAIRKRDIGSRMSLACAEVVEGHTVQHV
jgi:hypothetical protein